MLLSVEHLVKEFHLGRKVRVHAVNDVSFMLDAGRTLGLVGESGSGKTTVGRCILRTIEPTSGRIVYDGRDIVGLSKSDMQALRREIQIVFQDPFESLDPRMVAGEIVREPLRIRKAGSRLDQRRRVVELADKVGLAREMLECFPRELSAGQQQRVGIARAIATEPRLLVLDEAVSNLDPSARYEIIELLREIQAEMGLTYLFISHDLNTVRYISDRVAVMYLGKLVELGPTKSIFDEQLHPYSRALLSSALFPDPEQPRPSYTLKGEIPSPTELPQGCFLASRCPEAHEPCTIAYPPMTIRGPDRAASCFLLGTGDSDGSDERPRRASVDTDT